MHFLNLLSRALQCCLALCVALLLALPAVAFADDDLASVTDFSSLSLADLKKVVSAKAKRHEEAKERLNTLDSRLASVRKQLNRARAEIDEVQELAERSVRERYKVQRQYGTLLDALLCAEDLDSFIAGVEYIEAASKASVVELTDIRREIEECKEEEVELEEERATADERLALYKADLEEAVKARDEAQRKADLVTKAKLKPDGADWKSGEKAFVDEWGPRIDRYLAGSPMSGQGDVFAEAAWKNHVDPRFSPAISNIESGKGQICIRPYNAWGWGAADSNPYGLAKEWSSWEEAINAHVSGLAEGYGYSITQKGARKYCPPNWELWYATTVDQMNSI